MPNNKKNKNSNTKLDKNTKIVGHLQYVQQKCS